MRVWSVLLPVVVPPAGGRPSWQQRSAPGPRLHHTVLLVVVAPRIRVGRPDTALEHWVSHPPLALPWSLRPPASGLRPPTSGSPGPRGGSVWRQSGWGTGKRKVAAVIDRASSALPLTCRTCPLASNTTVAISSITSGTS